jgi:hypothetical protein
MGQADLNTVSFLRFHKAQEMKSKKTFCNERLESPQAQDVPCRLFSRKI